MPVDMVGAADDPHMLLAECLKGGMLLAVVREGDAQVRAPAFCAKVACCRSVVWDKQAG